MSKQLSFIQRCIEHGQTVVVYPFIAYPTGTYVDAWGGEPDPDSLTYPVTQPSVSYGTPVSLKAYFQPVSTTKKEELIMAPWGEEVRIAARVMIPGNQAVSHRDKIVAGSDTFYVVGIAPWKDGDVEIYKEVMLTEVVPRV